MLKHHCTFWPIFCSFLQVRAQVLLTFPEQLLRRTMPTSHLEGWPCATLFSLASLSRNKHGFPSVSLCIVGSQPAAWLLVEQRAASSACSYWAAGSDPARLLPPKHVDAHAAFSSTAKLFPSKSRDQGPHKEPVPFSSGICPPWKTL